MKSANNYDEIKKFYRLDEYLSQSKVSVSNADLVNSNPFLLIRSQHKIGDASLYIDNKNTRSNLKDA